MFEGNKTGILITYGIFLIFAVSRAVILIVVTSRAESADG